MYYENICRIPDVRKIFPLHYIFEMLLIIGGKGCKEKSLTQFAWLTIRKKAFGQLSKYDLESLTHKCEISQEEEVLCKIKSCFEFWEKQKADSGSCNSNILKTYWVLLQHQLITVRTHNLFLHKLHMEWCMWNMYLRSVPLTQSSQGELPKITESSLQILMTHVRNGFHQILVIYIYAPDELLSR